MGPATQRRLALAAVAMLWGAAGCNDDDAAPLRTPRPTRTETATIVPTETAPPTHTATHTATATETPTVTPTQTPRFTPGAIDDLVRINEIQVIGSHNSYHIEPRPALLSALIDFSREFLGIEYTHPPLDQQFQTQGIRQIELDVFADPDGGLYYQRRVLQALGDDPNSQLPQLREPGFKVLHIQDVDFESNCLTLIECLQTIKQWSDDHPLHLPIFVLIEAKDEVIPDPLRLGFVVPVEIGAEEFDALDAEIRSVFAPEQLITPDDVRGEMLSLEGAVLSQGWPTLRQARGRVIFGLDNGGSKRDLYRNGRPSLEGRVLFTPGTPGDPDAAFIKENDPLGEPDHIPGLVSSGYIVRTRADADTVQARTGDTTQRVAALASGAQYVSTDYRVPDPDFGTDYQVSFPDGLIARCNPVNAPAECVDGLLE